MNYNQLIYKRGPVKYEDYISDRYDHIHYNLYLNALNKYLTEYIQDLIKNKILYTLFNCMNNCLINSNGYLSSENIQLIKETLNNTNLHYLTINNINENFYQKENFDKLYNFIQENPLGKYIKEAFKELNIIQENDQYQYILYLVINILYILNNLKDDIRNIIYLTDIVNISDFIISVDNVNFIYGEDGLTKFNLESDENNLLTIFIYEFDQQNNIHISYNSYGQIILEIQNINIDEFELQLNEIINKSNYNIINIMVDDFISKYKFTHKIIEYKNSEYYLPSKILIFDNLYPHHKIKVDLSNYWSDYQDLINQHSYIEVKNKENNINDLVITDINYIQGTVKLYSKSFDEYYYTTFDRINENFEIDDSILNNTFGQKLINLQYTNSHYE